MYSLAGGYAVPSHAPDHSDPLARERAHLTASRAALRVMRADVEALDLRDVAANWVNAEALHHQVSERIKALADLADTPLFFGRLDYLHAPGAETAEGAEGERFYIGRRHVHDADGDPMVIDWRAPVSQAFYQASKKAPMDIGLRRRFGYTGGELTAYEDERLSDPTTETFSGSAGGSQTSKLLQSEIERPRVGPMRDIVATIQPEQDEIVRQGIGGTICVQGAPGTGKTAVGLHRVAYLLYAYRERLAR
ncbi:AAA family ATPase, partial [Streptomyces asiaticus]